MKTTNAHWRPTVHDWSDRTPRKRGRMNPFRKRDDELYQEIASIKRMQIEILQGLTEILTLLRNPPKDPREELMRKNAEMLQQIDQALRRIRAVDRLKPGS